MTKKQSIKRGDIFYAELIGTGSQQMGVRPVLVYSNNVNNIYSPVLNVIPLSKELKELCVHVLVDGCGLKSPSMVMVEQITTINKTQLRQKIGRLSSEQLQMVDRAADIQFARKKTVVPTTTDDDNPFGAA